MLENIAYFEVLGRPLVFYFGFLALFSFILTGASIMAKEKGFHAVPYKYHGRLAVISFVFAALLGVFCLSCRLS